VEYTLKCFGLHDPSIRRGKGKEERQVAIYLSKVMSAQTSEEIGLYFGIKGRAVSEVIKGTEGWRDEEIQLRKEIESLRGKIIIEF
jgi:chromosomal replication initiation ATPase DnaA